MVGAGHELVRGCENAQADRARFRGGDDPRKRWQGISPQLPSEQPFGNRRAALRLRRRSPLTEVQRELDKQRGSSLRVRGPLYTRNTKVLPRTFFKLSSARISSINFIVRAGPAATGKCPQARWRFPSPPNGPGVQARWGYCG